MPRRKFDQSVTRRHHLRIVLAKHFRSEIRTLFGTRMDSAVHGVGEFIATLEEPEALERCAAEVGDPDLRRELEDVARRWRMLMRGLGLDAPALRIVK